MTPDEPEGETFHLSVDGGPEQLFEARTGIYSHAVMEAFGKLGLPYPCDVKIWVPRLVEAGYGPYHYRIADFVDARGDVYGCPAVMTASPP